MTAPAGPLPSRDELLSIALEAATAAASLITGDRPEDLGAETKSSPTDLVTLMDRRSEALIAETIRRYRPDDRIVGEEAAGADPVDPVGEPSGVTWWVDPIDGTTNYVYDHPGYAVSVAAQLDGRTVAGVVADPTHGRVYRATLGGGAFCDDEHTGRSLRLDLGDPPPLDRALVATGFSYLPDVRATQARVVAELIARVRDIRRMGAAALDLCSVASGRVDAYYEAGLSVWDYAAGALVAGEAGASVTALDGSQVRPGSVLCAHPRLAERLIEELRVIGPGDSIGPGE